MREFFDETWLEENTRLEQERVRRNKKIREHILVAVLGILGSGVLYVFLWIGTALND